MNRYLAQEKRVFDISKFTVVGSPTITSDGVASGFSSGNYIKYPYQSLGDNFEIIFPAFKANDVTVTNSFLFCTSSHGLRVQLYNSKIRTLYFVGNDSYPVLAGTTTLQNNIEYLYKVVRSFDGTNYTVTAFLSSDNGATWVQQSQTTTDKPLFNNVEISYLGGNPNMGAQVFAGSIDLKSIKITVDNQTVFTGTKPVHLLERRKEGFDLSKFTVVGSPTITEYGVYTCGYDKASYIKVPFDNTLDNFSINIEIDIKDSTQQGNYLGHSNNISYGFMDAHFNGVGTTDFRIRVKDNDGNVSTLYMGAVKYQVGINKINLTFTGTYYLLTRTEANGTITTYKLETTNKPATNFFSLGNSNKADVTLTTINLTKITVTVDGKEVFTGAKESYYVLRR